jgi:hypothetical protein
MPAVHQQLLVWLLLTFSSSPSVVVLAVTADLGTRLWGGGLDLVCCVVFVCRADWSYA